ncbi:MAG: hypothetical protein R2746_16525 [Acidimicrobiales bacterium]
MIELVEQLDLDGSADDLHAWLEDWFDAYEADGGVISTWQDMQTSPGCGRSRCRWRRRCSPAREAARPARLRPPPGGHRHAAGPARAGAVTAHTLGFSTRAGEIDATATIIRRGFLGIHEA